jgi:hypothetical protein
VLLRFSVAGHTFCSSSRIKTLRCIPRGEPSVSGAPHVEDVLALFYAETYAQRSAETVPGIHETAYPRLKASVMAHDLAEVYTPTPEEMTLAAPLTGSESAQACFVLLLKTFQRLGYFIYLHDVPDAIITHIMAYFGVTLPRAELEAYDRSGTRRRHVTAIREYLQVKPYG